MKIRSKILAVMGVPIVCEHLFADPFDEQRFDGSERPSNSRRSHGEVVVRHHGRTRAVPDRRVHIAGMNPSCIINPAMSG